MKSNLFGPLEKQIMDILWEAKKPLKPLEVLKSLKGDHAYTTIMTVLKRMADKMVLTRKLVGKAYEYAPVAGKEKYIRQNLSTIYGDLVNNYGNLAISEFVDQVKNNQEDMDLLKEYINSKSKS